MCWRGRRELITDVRKPEIMNLWRHCRRRLFADYSDHPRKLVTLNPKLKSTGAGRYDFFPVGGMPTASSLAWKTSLRKVGTLWHCSRLRSVALYLWLIIGDIRQAIDRYLNIWASLLQALVMVSSSMGWQPDCKIQRSGRNGQRDWCEQSHRDYLRSGYLRRLPIMGAIFITVITPYLKAQRDKNAEGWSWRTRQLLTCRCVSVMLLRSMQNTRRS